MRRVAHFTLGALLGLASYLALGLAFGEWRRAQLAVRVTALKVCAGSSCMTAEN